MVQTVITGLSRRLAPVFLIKYRNLPPETIGVPPLAKDIVPSGTARKAAGDLQGLRPAGQTSAGLLVVLAFRRLLAGGRNCASSTIFEGYGAQKTSVFWATTPVPPERSRRNA